MSTDQLMTSINDSTYLSFDVRRQTNASEQFRLRLSDRDSLWQPGGAQSQVNCSSFTFPPIHLQHQNVVGGNGQVWTEMRGQHALRTYHFLTERRIAPHSGFSTSELASDGSNLAFCLNHLKSHNGGLHRQLNRLVQHVLPHIKSINAIPENNGFAIRINHVEDDENRGDLAAALPQVGTGVGNVIAMLYVALTAQHSRTILLEEPNSYLHPRALRELLAILADTEVPHQFFITTHSSDVLRSIKASTVTHLDYDGQTSTRKQVKGESIGELKAGLMNMGIRLSDLHGCDHVLWVEGQTEGAVFPLLIRKFFGSTASSVAVLRVHATSDFEGAGDTHHLDPIKVATIYEQLSTGNALAPHMVGIVLDREGRQKSECERIEKGSNGRIHFLLRPMLENYFLHPAAIAELVRERTGTVAAVDEIATKLAEAKSNPNLWIKPHANNPEIHAAKTLKHIFNELTDGRFEYSKTRDGPLLAEFLLRHDEGALSELRELLTNVLLPSAA